MSTKQIRVTAAVLAAGLALFTGACGDDSSGSTPSPQTSAGAPGPAASGTSVALVDGKALDGKFDTTCAKQGGVLALALTDLDNAVYGRLSVSATLSDDKTVQAVGIAGSKGGSSGMPYAVGYGNGQPGGSATVVKDGDTYKVTGEGVAAPDMSNPTAAPAAVTFDLTFACTTVVNG
ncbi:lipoprotein LpqH [Nocardia transvalensis]|uniref:Lipoprotein LpqH n=1 Tax=Nocardia transvalensis TaxID=37333 RepID=A0A7W9UKQ9_9NOCA|nr:lipoprotein LpqH [Nocardia transvalensis]MBB5916562.1 lipoprotein LpqH [Nocardia transvalensis]